MLLFSLLKMLTVFVILLCRFSDFQHFFLSISHGTGCSVSVLVACYFYIPHPSPFSISIHSSIFVSMNPISPLSNNRISKWCVPMVTSPSFLASLLLKVKLLWLATLPAFLVTRYIHLHSVVLRLFWLEWAQLDK